MNIKLLIFSAFLILFAADTFAQSSGIYEIKQAVIASGGGQNSASGNFSLDATIGQSIAGGSQSGSPFTLTSGFWNFTPSAPTAASVNVGGRAITANGRGIRNVLVTMVKPSGETRTVITGVSGYFRFNEVEVGETYIIYVAAKRFAFSQPVQICSVLEEITELNFVAEPY